MRFLKGFAQGVGIFIVALLVIAVITLIVITPFFVFQELFGEPTGSYIALVFDSVMGAGLLGMWIEYECGSDQGDLPPPSA